MNVRFVIHGRLNGTNEIIRDAARNRYRGGSMRKADKEKCKWEIGVQNIHMKAHFKHPVELAFAWIEPNAKRDLDNITGGQKVVIDALVLCGVIPNDTRQWVKGISHRFPDPDPKNPRVEVTVMDDEL